MRIEDKFKQLKKEGRKAFIAYVPFGFPKPACTGDIILTLQDSGVDIIELGIPFSDPLADGPIIQKASAIALANGATVDKAFKVLKNIKNSLNIPIVIMTYYNPLYRYNQDKFFKKMKEVGASGIMVVDLPVYEARDYIKKSRQYDLETVFFITPTTKRSNAVKIAKVSRGFIYYISVTGITGPKFLNYKRIKSNIVKLKSITHLPVCIGFGIHKPAQLKHINSFCDGAIVGSALVKFIESNFRKKSFSKLLTKYIRGFISP
ncbi:MAG: tryptophan synthase subunit alpha [Candidatus Omnitrophota bacterium]